MRCGQVICVKFGHDARITELRNRQRDIKDELKELDAEKAKLIKFKHLLYGTGKAVLET